MRIIGVIDLKDGAAVHARGGRRHLYAEVDQSAGVDVKGSAPRLARHYIDAFGLSDVYLADLDAIASGAPQAEAIQAISTLGASLWVDGGISGVAAAKAMAGIGARMLVVGLETLPSFDTLADICVRSTRPVAFSLDLRGGTPMHAALAARPPEELARHAVEAGAHTVIVLDVARVGSSGGPDFDLLRRIRATVPDVELFAGGGVRGLDDLRQLAGVGCAGALIASALHDGRLSKDDVEAARRL